MTIPSSLTGSSPFRTFERSILEAEAACLEADESPARLPQNLLQWLDGGSFLPPRALLGELEPFLPRLFSGADPRLVLADAFIAVWNRLHPFMLLRRLASGRPGDPIPVEGRLDLWIEAGLPEDGTRLDLAWLLPPLIRSFPRAFSLPEFEAVQAVADPRPVRSFLDPATGFRHEDGMLALGGMRLGEAVDLPAHLRKSMETLPDGWERNPAPRNRATLIRADYYCPRRKRVLLQAGCAYGAPGFLLHVGFRALRPPAWNPLSRIIRAIMVDGTLPTNALPPTQEDSPAEFSLDTLVKDRAPQPSPRAAFRFVYHQSDDSISCDGRHLTKNVPARILRRLVRDYVESGRREFEFRIFKRDADIVTNRKRPNFEVRLRRVQEVVLGVPCGLILHRPRPGFLELETAGPIEYSEET